MRSNTKQSITRAVAVGLTAAVMSTGSVVAAFRSDAAQAGYAILWPVVPMTILLCIVAAINGYVLTPRLLRQGRFAAYLSLLFIMTYVAMNMTFGMEYVIRERLDLPHRISNYHSPWILVDSLSNTMLIMFLLAGFSLIGVYGQWKWQSERLQALHGRLEDNMRRMKEMLDPKRIFRSIDRTIRLVGPEPDGANEEIHSLSDYLRHQLYELPQFEWRRSEDALADEQENRGGSRLQDFMVQPRYCVARIVLFQLFLALIAAESLFDTPDSPAFTWSNLLSALSLYAFLNVIAFVNIKCLYPHYLKRNHNRQYIRVSVIVMVVLGAISIPLQLATFPQSVYSHDLPVVLTCLSALSSMATILIFLFGTASIIYMQQWIRGTYEISELQAQTSVCELDFLKKQINPHFLFNVLNNTGIMIYEDASVAIRMLKQLKVLLRYQLEESGRSYTTFGEETEFLRSYLLLEQSRRSRFEFSMDVPEGCNNLRIPVLLYIPFVENAVKYCSVRNGWKRVAISFEVNDNELSFTCVNGCECDDTVTESRSGGIGIANTVRRLELMYGGRFDLDYGKHPGSEGECDYIVELKIGLDK